MLYKTKHCTLLLLLTFIFSTAVIANNDCVYTNSQFQDSVKGLKTYFSNYFTMGVAINARAVNTDEANFIVQQFGSITAENTMKMGPIHPKEHEYYWKDADAIVEFALTHQLKIRGHNLCWHQQAPSWLFTDEKGDTLSKERLLERLKEHITAVVSRFKGKIYAWDVVNEAISDNPDEFYRNSPWYRICGEEFIAKAFEYAHEADPNALLFYNDYNEINPQKREKMYQLVKGLKDAGVPISGIGLQGHWSVSAPSEEQLTNTIQSFASLALPIQITELDISVYESDKKSKDGNAADLQYGAFTMERENAQMERYITCFRVFEKFKKQITGITFWNISDRSSWLDNFPIRGRKNYPLLFDKNLQPKKVFYEVVNTLNPKK